ncbi:hypothetical protein GALL_493420 [mine drainage metagenome]|uniref:Uncharacterized protein n=1 Tax=mine drainage metagenome TaxID=410659 RepID=A0A1J5PCK5_9ZZZZ
MPALARTTPVTPPMVNTNRNPIAKSIGVLNSIEPPHMVAIQEKILIPVGTAITKVAPMKYARVSTSMPDRYMWWAHTTKPTTPIPTMAYTMPR